jgi:hypothetical protein
VASDFAIALSSMTSVWESLLATHVPDAEGRCKECRWQTRAADRWPCSVHDVAAAARDVAAESQGGR